jgi:hypothetical protein
VSPCHNVKRKPKPTVGLFLAGAKLAKVPLTVLFFDLQHAEGTRYADWIEGERILNEVIYECQRSLEEIGHAKLDQEARSWARGMGLRE